MAAKLGGGGGKALVAWPLVEELFLRLPLQSFAVFVFFGILPLGFGFFFQFGCWPFKRTILALRIGLYDLFLF